MHEVVFKPTCKKNTSVVNSLPIQNGNLFGETESVLRSILGSCPIVYKLLFWYNPCVVRRFEELFRNVANRLELKPGKKIGAVRIGHDVDCVMAKILTASGSQDSSLDGVVRQIEWLTRILEDGEVRGEWERLYREETAKLGRGLNAAEDWRLRRVAFNAIQEKRQSF